MCVPCVLPGDVLTHLELLGNCFDEQVVVWIPNIPGVTRLPLESFLVRTQLKPVEPLLWPSVKIYLPYVAATPFMLSPVLFPADPAAPGALPQPLQVLSLFCD